MMRTNLLWMWMAVVCVVGCANPRFLAIPGTTTRVTLPQVEQGMEYNMHILHEIGECDELGIPEEEMHLCLPFVDRSSGEIRLSYALYSDETLASLPEHEELLSVEFQGTTVGKGTGGQEMRVIPHDPWTESGTLYILVIDGSGSMNEPGGGGGLTRMQVVKQALKRKDVMDAFFGGEGQDNAVMILQFTQGTPTPVGGEFIAFKNRREYKAAVTKLKVLNGYTHLFDAVAYATGPLLERQEVKKALANGLRQPNVIVLTDGFNNMRASDVCGDNVERLELLLDHLKDVQVGDLNVRPEVHTVGLGRPIRPGFEIPSGKKPPRAADLCGKRNVDTRIDGNLELRGIDNASLHYIARAGGGKAHIKRGKRALAKAFQEAASPRYRWFEVRIRMDPFYLRRDFKIRLALLGVASAASSIEVYPSAWLDAPPGRSLSDGWHVADTYHRTLVVIVPLIALFVTLSYLGAALHNTRRMLFGRVRKRGSTPEERLPES
jgi:hypothetical protein